MNTNPDLLDINAVSKYFSLSESSIRRRVRATREGNGNFPLPLFGSGCRVLWRKSDIENWRGEDAEVITYTPSLVLPAQPVVPIKNKAQVRKGLEAHGITFPKSNESNT